MRLQAAKLLTAVGLAALLTLPVACDDDDDNGGVIIDVGDTAVGDAGDSATGDTATGDTATGDTATGDTGTDDTRTDTGGGGATISAADQTLDDLTTVVGVTSASVDAAAFVVIHEDDAGAPGDVIGHVAIAAGTTDSIRVVLDRPARNGDTLWAMLHEDTGTAGEYEFPAADPPLQVDGAIVMESFDVTVPDGTPAVRITLSAVGFDDYIVDSVLPEGIGVAADGATDPELALRQGWRYEVVNTVSATHPFELLTVGATPGEDVVLLSEAADGTLEATASISWTDAAGTLGFTVSPELAAELDGYRCSVHITTMRGSITISP